MVHGNIESLKVFRWVFFSLCSWNDHSFFGIMGTPFDGRDERCFLIISNSIVAKGFEKKHQHPTQSHTFCVQLNPIFPSFVCLQSFYICLSHFDSLIYLKLFGVFSVSYKKIAFACSSAEKGCKLDIHIFSSSHFHHRFKIDLDDGRNTRFLSNFPASI